MNELVHKPLVAPRRRRPAPSSAGTVPVVVQVVGVASTAPHKTLPKNPRTDLRKNPRTDPRTNLRKNPRTDPRTNLRKNPRTDPRTNLRTKLRTNDPDRTMANIVEVATNEFADKGLAGARIDEIAAASRTSKRMIYYYFTSKEGLYVAVLEEAYRRIRQIESDLLLADLPPEAALRTLVGYTFDYQLANPDFVRLVMNENMHRGQYLAQSTAIQKLNLPAIDAVAAVYQRGVQAGVFRPDVEPLDLHMSISALCFFNVSNRHTFALVFKRDPDAPGAVAARRDSIIEMVVRFVRR